MLKFSLKVVDVAVDAAFHNIVTVAIDMLINEIISAVIAAISVVYC